MIDEISLSVDEFVFVLLCLRFMQLKTYVFNASNKSTHMLGEGSRKVHSRKKKGATRGLPRGSPILVLLSPKHA